MTIAVLLILVVIWAAVLIPPIVRARSQAPRSDTVGDFRHKLRILGQTNGTHREKPSRLSFATPAFAPVRSRARQTPAQKRRQDVLCIMVGVCAGTLFLAVLSRMPAVFVLHVLADALLVVYVYLLLRHKHRASEQRSKVRYLNRAYRSPLPYLVGDGTSESTGPRLVPLRQTASR